MSTNVYGRDSSVSRRGETDERRGYAGPVRSGDPERDWYIESRAATARSARSAEQQSDRRQLHRMSWRAEGAQDYPGGALDTLVAASHRGRGPKNYRRTDEFLHDLICEQLTEDPFVDASDVDVDVTDGEVTLSGTVPARSHKMRSEDLVADIDGVKEIHNMLSIRSDEDREIEYRMSGL